MKPMKVLAISAFYPPYDYGGYENRVCNILDELHKRGQKLIVLTTRPDSNKRAGQLAFAYPVLRRIHWLGRKRSFPQKLTLNKVTHSLGVGLVFIQQIWHDILDLRFVANQIRVQKPDLIYLGHIIPFTRTLMPFLSQYSIPIVVDEGGKSIKFTFEEPGLWFRFQTEFQPKSTCLKWLKKVFNSFVFFLSGGRLKQKWSWPQNLSTFINSNLNLCNLLEANPPIARFQVIHSGLDLDLFTFARKKEFGCPLTILLPARIEPQKGQTDALRLVVALKKKGIESKVTIVGDPWNREYLDLIKEEIKGLVIEDSVAVLPMAGKEALVDLYQQSDICFFSSHYHSGFSRIPLEALACGSVLFTYGNEGSDEIIEDKKNGFIFQEQDYEGMVCRIEQLISNPSEVSHLIKQARSQMESEFSMTSYVDKIENFMETVLLEREVVKSPENPLELPVKG